MAALDLLLVLGIISATRLSNDQVTGFSAFTFRQSALLPRSANENDTTRQQVPIPFFRGKSVLPLYIGTASSSSSNDTASYGVHENSGTRTSTTSEQLEMPWNDWQEWALRDNLAKYRVSIVGREYVLWRSMVRDVTELAGYEVSFVRKMYARSSEPTQTTTATPGLLPLLDQFQFESMGGITGKAYGLAGIAQGATIQTPALVHMEDTVPKGYVVVCGTTTISSSGDGDDDMIAYELGVPKETSDLITTDNDDRYRTLSTLASTVSKSGLVAVEKGQKQVANIVEGSNGILDGDEDNSSMGLLVNLGGATAMVLTAATVLNAFQHHLTVNVFWV